MARSAPPAMTTVAAPPRWRLALPILLVLDLALIATTAWSPQILAGVVALAALGLLWIRPHRVIAFVIAGLPLLDPIFARIGRDAIPPALPVLLLAIPLAAAFVAEPDRVLAGSSRAGRFRDLLADPIVLSTVALAIVLQLGLLWTRAPMYGGSKALLFTIFNLVLLVATWWFLGRGDHEGADVERGLGFLQWIVWLEAGIAVLALWNHHTHYYHYGERLRALGLNTIWLGRHMGMGVLAICALYAARRLRLFWALLLAGLCGVVFFLSGSRGPLAALAPSLALWWILDPGRRGRTRLVVTLGAAVVGIVGALWLIESGAILEDTPFAGHDASNLARVLMLQGAQQNLASAGWLGYGTGSFGPLLNLGDIRIYPHNILLEIGVENGLLGLATFLCFLAAVLHRWVRSTRRKAIDRGDPRERWRDVLVRVAGVQWFYAFANAQFSGDLPQNPWIWLWAAALAVWAR
ncbi:MAG: O-antigen ligase family protein [Candidatus Eisenbacteria bacterium]|uniref:O-antigen ligase family protein n=1 Tax=Eiseniibacteriota bacterium TaxID=2212470 RepID=A0A956LZ52_UNCEI|nr:O-antigen ligase family protein [Candidatus Eisenbacteria bacterium]